MHDTAQTTQTLCSLIRTIGYNVQDADDPLTSCRLKTQLLLLKILTGLLKQYAAGEITDEAFQDRLDEIDGWVIDRSRDPICWNLFGDYHADLCSIEDHLRQLPSHALTQSVRDILNKHEISNIAEELSFMTDAKGDFCIDVEEAKVVKKFVNQLKKIHGKLNRCIGLLRPVQGT